MRVFILILICISNKLYGQKLDFSLYLASANWHKPFINRHDYMDSSKLGSVKISQSKIFDYGVGFGTSIKIDSVKNIKINCFYESNFIDIQAFNFYRNGSIIRRMRLNYLNLNLNYQHTFKNPKYLIFAGLNLSYSIGLNRSVFKSSKTFIPSNTFGAVYLTEEKIFLYKPGFIYGVNCGAGYFFNPSLKKLLFFNINQSFNPAMKFSWYFRNSEFAKISKSRLVCSLGVRFLM